MNKNAIQKFAIWARNELIAQVSQRAYQYGIDESGFGDASADTLNGRLLTAEEKSQRQELIKRIKEKGYQQVMEEVAYTWFNRFIALRFMEVNNYLPSHIRVFSDASGAFKPEILNDVLHLDLPGLNSGKVAAYIESNDTEALYRYLLLTQCNALNSALPVMFERMGGYTEMLLPNNILRQDSVLGHMVSDIPEGDWQDAVQIIGWLYQYYNTELKAIVLPGIKSKTSRSQRNSFLPQRSFSRQTGRPLHGGKLPRSDFGWKVTPMPSCTTAGNTIWTKPSRSRTVEDPACQAPGGVQDHQAGRDQGHRPLHGQRSYPCLCLRCADADLYLRRLGSAGGGAEHSQE